MRIARICVELFAGAGGLALGLNKAGFHTRGLVERDKYCCETLRRNSSRYFQSSIILQRDIRRLTAQQLLSQIGVRQSQIDLVSGGPPCQSFSVCKIPKGGRSPDDPRDTLLAEFSRLV